MNNKKILINIIISFVLVAILATTLVIYKINEGANKFDNNFSKDTYVFKQYNKSLKYSMTFYKENDEKYSFVEDFDGTDRVIECTDPKEYPLCEVYRGDVEKEFDKIYNVVTKLDYQKKGTSYVSSSSNNEFGSFEVSVTKGGKFLEFENKEYLYEIDLNKEFEMPKEKKE